MRVFSAKFKERADGRKQRERREASIRARAEKEEKKKREARNAPPPTDLFSGPTLVESMAAMQVRVCMYVCLLRSIQIIYIYI